MKYYRLLENYIKNSGLTDERIYPADYVIPGISGDGLLKIEFYVKNCDYFQKHYWQEVSEKEYWQQELEAGRLVKGGYYVNSESVIQKSSGTKDAEYYVNLGQENFKRNKGSFQLNNVDTFYRLATQDEIDYLEHCNKLDKFVTKEEFMESKEFKLPEKWVVLNPKNEESQLLYDYADKYGANPPYYNGTYFHFPKVSDYVTTSADKVNGYTEITFKEFKKYVLNQEKMESKKIIGYKLIKPEFKKLAVAIEGFNTTEFANIEGRIFTFKKHQQAINKWETAEILNEWFEPVYEEEFKVGDWCCVIDSGTSQLLKGNVYKLNQISKSEYHLKHYHFDIDGKNLKDNACWLGATEFRKATKEEIEAATVIKIKGYTAQANHAEGTVTVGCQTFDYDDVRSVIKVINAGLKVEDSDQIKKLWDKIK